MSLESGTRFGVYEITGQIGAGGMGVVYRATDTDLKRDVAIKLLPASFAEDADRLARFQREAEILASLNHPNIAQIFGIERKDEAMALVMELVEGPTLADRIEQGPLPADEALNVAMQLCDALEAAHEQKIVHRDLKPANIKLRPDGTVKVLDFGIAKAVTAPMGISGEESPALTTPAMTMAGIVLGTAAYMSPEQARGRPIDRRTDIWAFGCLLYEMLTGQPAFGGEDVPMTLARVLSHGTNLDSLPGIVTPAVRHTIALCLEKNPKKRIADIADVRLALQGRFEQESLDAGGVVYVSGWRRVWPAAAALVLGVLVTAAAFYGLRPDQQPNPVNRFQYLMPDGEFFQNTGRNVIALSPDGRRFVYNTSRGLVLREMDTLEVRVIPGTQGDITNPFFSPDGGSIGFWWRSGEIGRVAIGGGAPITLAGGIGNPFGARWDSDDDIVYGDQGDVFRLTASPGSEPELLIAAAEGEAFASPQLLPDGDKVLLTLNDSVTNWNNASIVTQSLSTGERIVVLPGGRDARYLPSGHITYSVGDDLMVTPFDPDTSTVSGTATVLAQDVNSAEFTASVNYAVAADGTLIYLSGVNSNLIRYLVWIDLEGREVDLVGDPAMHWNPRISPDGTRLAIEIADDTNDGIEIYDLIRGGAPTRVSFDSGVELRPVFTPDSRYVIFASEGDQVGLIRRRTDGTGQEEEILADEPGMDSSPEVVTADGDLIFRWTEEQTTTWDLYRVSLDGGTPELLIDEPNSQGFSSLSPDGKWLTYSSYASGAWEIYARPYPDVDSGERIKVSTTGGIESLWHPDGTALYYIAGNDVMVVQVDYSSPGIFGIPEILFAMGDDYVFGATSVPNWDIHPDGDRFIMLKPGGDGGSAEPASIVIVQQALSEVTRTN